MRSKSARSAWITYTVLRVLLFAVPFGLLYVLGLSAGLSMMVSALVAAALAALLSLALSMLLLSKPREAASESIYQWRNRKHTADDVVEDAALDSEEAGATTGEDQNANATPSNTP